MPKKPFQCPPQIKTNPDVDPTENKPRGKVGWQKGRKRGAMSQGHRDKISKSAILGRLIAHAEGKLSPAGRDGRQEMSATQVTAALSLLDRYLPKVTQVQLDADVKTEERIEAIKIISVAPNAPKLLPLDDDDSSDSIEFDSDE